MLDFFDYVIDFFNMIGNAFKFTFRTMTDVLALVHTSISLPFTLEELVPPIIASSFGLVTAIAVVKFILAR